MLVIIKLLNKGIRFFNYFVARVVSYWFQIQLCKYGKNFRVTKKTTILAPENISIGDDFAAMDYLYLYGNEGSIEIGNNVRINTNVQIGASAGEIVIGNNVLIAANVVIRAADHGTKVNQLVMSQPHTTGKIIIEDDVWIGSNCVITSNVTLKKGTIVGAGAVVTRSTEPNSIVGGIPARKISERK